MITLMTPTWSTARTAATAVARAMPNLVSPATAAPTATSTSNAALSPQPTTIVEPPEPVTGGISLLPAAPER
jgi:hypothetical protein